LQPFKHSSRAIRNISIGFILPRILILLPPIPVILLLTTPFPILPTLLILDINSNLRNLLPTRNAHLVFILEPRAAAAVALVPCFGLGGAQFLQQVIHGAG